MTRWPSPSAVGGSGVVVRLVDRLPPGHQVAERVGHEVDVAAPDLGPIGLDEESARRQEPPGEREVVEAHPGRDPRLVGGGQDVAVVPDGGRVVDAGLGLEARPLHRQAVVGQAETGEEGEVLGIAGAEAVAVTRQRCVARPLPVPPVRGGCRPLALRRRRAGPPPESFRPLHGHEYDKRATIRDDTTPRRSARDPPPSGNLEIRWPKDPEATGDVETPTTYGLSPVRTAGLCLM